MSAAVESRPSVCPLDCPDTCSLSVTVEDGRVARVRGSRANPFTAGAICAKVSDLYPEYVHGATRLRRPLIATGPRGSGQFAPVSWDEALDRVHDGFTRVIDRHGPEAVVPFNYAGPHGMLADGSMDRRFFHRLGASLLDRGPLCGGIRGLAWTSLFGNMPGLGPEQAEHAELVIVWSNNVTVSNLHLARVINRARRARAAEGRPFELVVIDPKRIRIADQADLHIAPKPGTDVVLAFALANELERLGAFDAGFIERWTVGFDAWMARAREFPRERAADICGIDAGDIEKLATLYASRSPAAISIGNGMERSRTGGASIRAACALPVLTGKLGTVGDGLIVKPGFAFPKTSDRLERSDFVPAGTRTLNILDVPGAILDNTLAPPVRGLFIYNHNPVATHPDQRRMRQALAHPELFVVGCDVSMTDSMAFADVILPAASHFEFADLYGAYGQQWLQRAEPVIEPVGESLPNTEIFRRLAARFGFEEDAFRASDAALMDEAVDADDPRLGGHRPSALPLDGALHMNENGAPYVAFDNVFPKTPSGKVELYSADLAARFGAGLPAYSEAERDAPLVLISPSSDRRTNATFGGCAESLGLEHIEMHVDDAAARKLVSGDRVRVWNALGEVELELRVSDRVRPGVVYSPKGTWLATSPSGETINALVPDARSDIADGACFNDTCVEVAALG